MLYFAYGSMMDFREMRQRCPSAQFIAVCGCPGLVNSITCKHSSRILPNRSESPAFTWSEEEIEDFLRGANVINRINEEGFRKAATAAFLAEGYHLATITHDIEPFETITKLSTYVLGDRAHASRRDSKKIVRRVMAEIGCKLKADECMIHTSGRRLVASIFLPRWAWIR